MIFDELNKSMLEAWRITVERVKQLDNLDAIAAEWLALSQHYSAFAKAAHDRYLIHVREESPVPLPRT